MLNLLISKYRELVKTWNRLPSFLKLVVILTGIIHILTGVGLVASYTIVYKSGNEMLVTIVQAMGLMGVVSFVVSKKMTKMMRIFVINAIASVTALLLTLLYDEKFIVVLDIIYATYEVYSMLIMSRAMNKLKMRFNSADLAYVNQLRSVLVAVTIMVLTPLLAHETKIIMIVVADIFELAIIVVTLRTVIKYRTQIIKSCWIDKYV